MEDIIGMVIGGIIGVVVIGCICAGCLSGLTDFLGLCCVTPIKYIFRRGSEYIQICWWNLQDLRQQQQQHQYQPEEPFYHDSGGGWVPEDIDTEFTVNFKIKKIRCHEDLDYKEKRVLKNLKQDIQDLEQKYIRLISIHSIEARMQDSFKGKKERCRSHNNDNRFMLFLNQSFLAHIDSLSLGYLLDNGFLGESMSLEKNHFTSFPTFLCNYKGDGIVNLFLCEIISTEQKSIPHQSGSFLVSKYRDHDAVTFPERLISEQESNHYRMIVSTVDQAIPKYLVRCQISSLRYSLEDVTDQIREPSTGELSLLIQEFIDHFLHTHKDKHQTLRIVKVKKVLNEYLSAQFREITTNESQTELRFYKHIPPEDEDELENILQNGFLFFDRNNNTYNNSKISPYENLISFRRVLDIPSFSFFKRFTVLVCEVVEDLNEFQEENPKDSSKNYPEKTDTSFPRYIQYDDHDTIRIRNKQKAIPRYLIRFSVRPTEREPSSSTVSRDSPPLSMRYAEPRTATHPYAPQYQITTDSKDEDTEKETIGYQKKRKGEEYDIEAQMTYDQRMGSEFDVRSPYTMNPYQ